LGRPIGGRHDGVDRHQDQEHGQRGTDGSEGGACRHDHGAGAGDRCQHPGTGVSLDIREAEEASDGGKEEAKTDQPHRDGTVQAKGVDGKGRHVAPFSNGQDGECRDQPRERPVPEQDAERFNQPPRPSGAPR
jgi:hypothetical protein